VKALPVSNVKPWFFMVVILACCRLLQGQEVEDSVLNQNEWISDFYEENEKCFRCHEAGVAPSEELTEETIYHLSSENLLFSREEFYNSNHRSFACTDCHGNDNTNLRELVKEGEFTCANCHGFDETSDQYHFALKVEEYNRSVHATSENIDFSCWECHNPHTYRSKSSETSSPPETITYHNTICLGCHSKLTHDSANQGNGDRKEFEHHDWLPNHTIHLSVVKCIECHTQINNGIYLTHLVLPGEQSEMRCVECHSQEPRWLATLYKYQAKEQRSTKGFFTGTRLHELSIFGMNGTDYLNTISIVIYLLALFAIAVHIYLRIRIKRTK
jgi:hypothetical protein